MTAVTVGALDALNTQIDALVVSSETQMSGVNNAWLIFGSALVFFMQAGFALLEAGSVRSTSVIGILFKNSLDAVISAFMMWFIGYGFAYGRESESSFIGAGYTMLDGLDRGEFAGFLFQWAFAATAGTICSGAVAERCQLKGFFVYATFLTGFVYPVVVHWGWSSCGWASAFFDGECYHYGQIGVIDFAGSGIVHMTGGFAALAGAIVLGPRRGVKTLTKEEKAKAFEAKVKEVEPISESEEPVKAKGVAFAPAVSVIDGEAVEVTAWDFRFASGVDDSQFSAHNIPLQALGTFILWFGWYGFNCVSTLTITGFGGVAAKVAANTTIGAAGGGLGALLFNRILVAFKHRTTPWDISSLMNGILGGLVSITASCAVIEPYGALAAGVIGGMVYVAASSMIKGLEVDDPLDAFAVHGACGFWGLLAAGIFAHSQNVKAAYGVDQVSGFYDKDNGGNQFDVQLAFGVAVAAWSSSMSFILFKGLGVIGWLRVPAEAEEMGVDLYEGMGDAYGSGGVGMTQYSAGADE